MSCPEWTAGARAEAEVGSGSIADFDVSRQSFGLAVGSLILAGCFALLLVIGRLPGLAGLIHDPGFFKRGLVIHVDLSLVVWFVAFGAGLFALLPGGRRADWQARAGFGVALTGVAGMVAAGMVPAAAPVLSNYVPVIDHPVFLTGLVLLFAGLLACFLNERLFVPWNSEGAMVPGCAVAGLKTVALAYVLAMTTFGAAWMSTPRWLETKAYYELVFWGGGHVLQVANVAAMLAVWLLLLSSLLDAPVVGGRTAWVLFGLLLAPHLAAPLLTLPDTFSPLYRLGFTRLMQWGIFPVVTVFLALCLHRVVRAFRKGMMGADAWRDPRLVGFAASATLTVLGFLLGAMIRSSNTMIPAHYHASIGAVTVAFMAAAYLLLEPVGAPLRAPRLRRLIPWQLGLFGVGQAVFALGFGWGGYHGLSRKAYGAEQHVRSLGEHVGLGIMSAGGLVAIAGGLLFLALMVAAALPRVRARSANRNLKPLVGESL